LGIRSAADLENHPMRGPLFENFIVVEFMKQFLHHEQRPNCYYWRDNTGHEIDLLIEHAGQIFPMEIKSSQTLKADFFKTPEFFQKISGTPTEQSFLVYAGTENQNRLLGNARSWDNLPVFD